MREEAIDCNWRRDGHVHLAFKESHFQSMQETAEWFRTTVGHPLRVVQRAELRAEIGSDRFFGGVVDDYSGGLHPARYVFGLARAAARQGAALVESCEVQAISPGIGFYDVATSRGVLRAREVVVATNGYTDSLLPALQERVMPAGSYIITTTPLNPEARAQISPKGRMFYDSKWFLNYFRLTPDGRMLWGGRNSLTPGMDPIKSAHILRKQMIAAFPQLRGTPITHSWSGQLGLTFDLLPHIGRIDGVHYALGYNGHGLVHRHLPGMGDRPVVGGRQVAQPLYRVSPPFADLLPGRPLVSAHRRGVLPRPRYALVTPARLWSILNAPERDVPGRFQFQLSGRSIAPCGRFLPLPRGGMWQPLRIK